MPVAVTALVAVVAAAVSAGFALLLRLAGGPPPPEVVAERAGLRALVRRRLDPLQVTGLALAVALAGILAALAAFGLMATLAAGPRLWAVDAGMARWGGAEATPLTTSVLGAVTQLGSTGTVVLLAAAAVAFEAARGRLRRGARGAAWFMAAVVAGQSLVVNLLKLLFQRPRPPVGEAPAWLAHADAVAAASGFAFPSGHAAASTATFAALALLLGRGRSRGVRVALAAGAAAVAGAVSTTRVLLAVHWVSDVIAGAAIGGLWFMACALAFGGRRLRLGSPLQPRPERGAGGVARSRTGRARPGTSRQGGTPMDGRDRPQDAEPTPEQVAARATDLAGEAGERETGSRPDNPAAQAGALLRESEERVEDPAARDPDDERVIRRAADEGVPPTP